MTTTVISNHHASHHHHHNHSHSISHNTDRLATLTQRLPPELFRMISDRTFTLSPPPAPLSSRSAPSSPHGGKARKILITPSYQPPSTLAVHRQLRTKMAQTYYNNTTFHSTSWRICARWLLSLQPDHLAALQVISCDFEDVGPPPGGPDSTVDATEREANLLRALMSFCELQDRMEEVGLFFGADAKFRICWRGRVVREYPATRVDGLPTVTEMMRRK